MKKELSNHSEQSERAGQAFGRKCWLQGLSLDDTLQLALDECGLDALPENVTKWPRFIHGVEESWQDHQLNHDDENRRFEELRERHIKK